MVDLSVILPVFNVEPYIERCLHSILAQTIGGIELIVVDDVSKDGSMRIARSILLSQDRVPFTFIAHKANRGLSAARNTGMEVAAGRYIIFLDSDDYIEPTMLARLMKECTEERADIVGCNLRPVAENGEPLSKAGPEGTGKQVVSGRTALLELFRGGRQAHICKHLFRKELFEDIRFPEGQIYEDLLTLPYLFMAAAKVVFLDEVLYYYVQRKGSISRRFNPVIQKNVSSASHIESALCAKWPDMEWRGDFLLFKYSNLYNTAYLAAVHADRYADARGVLAVCRGGLTLPELRGLMGRRAPMGLLSLLWVGPWVFFHFVRSFFGR